MVVPHGCDLGVEDGIGPFAFEAHCEDEVVPRGHPVLLEVVLIGDLPLRMGPYEVQVAVCAQAETGTGTRVLQQQVRDVVVEAVGVPW